MRTTECRGECPVYEIVIYKNGDVIYQGEKNVELTGKFEAHLTRDQKQKLIDLFLDHNFFAFEDSYMTLYKDLPTTYISFHHNGKRKKITDYDGAPESLKQLEEEVTSLIHTLEWTKTE